MRAAMPGRDEQPFRFMDLPEEIKAQVYELLLCCFDSTPLPTEVDTYMERPRRLPRLSHSIDTAILRTNKEIYRGAYEVMVKRNKFIHVRFEGVFNDAVSICLAAYGVPVITVKPAAASLFPGYVLNAIIDVHPATLLDGPPEDLDYLTGSAINIFHPADWILLGRDWETFCRMLGTIDNRLSKFTIAMRLSFTLNVERVHLFSDSFARSTQMQLLGPMEEHLRGFYNMFINGTTEHALVSRILATVSKPRYTNHSELLDDMESFEQAGNDFRDTGNPSKAMEQWVEGIRRCRSALCEQRTSRTRRDVNMQILRKIVALASTLRTNCIDVLIEDLNNDTIDEKVRSNKGQLALNHLQYADWGEGEDESLLAVAWEQEKDDDQFGWNEYRLAVIHRLLGNAELALKHILEAMDELPWPLDRRVSKEFDICYEFNKEQEAERVQRSVDRSCTLMQLEHNLSKMASPDVIEALADDEVFQSQLKDPRLKKWHPWIIARNHLLRRAVKEQGDEILYDPMDEIVQKLDDEENHVAMKLIPRITEGMSRILMYPALFLRFRSERHSFSDSDFSDD